MWILLAPFFIYGNSLRDAIDQLFSFIIQISEKKKELLLELRESKRFSNLLLSGYRNELDDLENLGQFSADMIQISDSLYFISYSGTDGTIMGQKKRIFNFLIHLEEKYYLFIICTKTRIFLAILQGNLQLYYFSL